MVVALVVAIIIVLDALNQNKNNNNGNSNGNAPRAKNAMCCVCVRFVRRPLAIPAASFSNFLWGLRAGRVGSRHGGKAGCRFALRKAASTPRVPPIKKTWWAKIAPTKGEGGGKRKTLFVGAGGLGSRARRKQTNIHRCPHRPRGFEGLWVRRGHADYLTFNKR